MSIRPTRRPRFAACISAMLLGASLGGSLDAAEGTPAWSDSLARNRPWQALAAMGDAPEDRQIKAQLSVFVGDEAPACALLPPRVPPADAGVEYRDAIEIITRAARDARVVMLNESHFRRAHRVFLGRLIEALHPLGFDALAAETFAAEAPATLKDGVPDAATGFYTADPAFASALQRAHALGWAFVPYEVAGVSGRDAREAGQAKVLAAWLKAHPGRRLLVYAGDSHILERPDEGWMAARFAADTGIDPLTIAQGATACPDAADAWPVDTPSPVIGVRDEASTVAKPVDFVVLHPPASIAAAEDARGPQVPLCVAPRAEATLLRAFADGDDDLAIPQDQTIVPPHATSGRLRLAPGRYRIARESAHRQDTLGEAIVPAGPLKGCLRIGPET